MNQWNLNPNKMYEFVKYLIIVAVLVGLVMTIAGETTGQTIGGTLLLWGIAGWTTVEEKR